MGELLKTASVSGRDNNALPLWCGRQRPMVWGVCRRHLHNHQEPRMRSSHVPRPRPQGDGRAEAGGPNCSRRGPADGSEAAGDRRRKAPAARDASGKRARTAAMEEARDADLRGMLDEELSRLPENYRGVRRLCDLEG